MASAPIDLTPDSENPDLPAEFVNYLQTEAENARDQTLDSARAAALHAYAGDPYGDEVEGQSGIVTRDVSEVVDFMLTGILGTVMAGGKAVEFETEPEMVEGPPGQDGQPTQVEVDYGAQATAAIRYQFFRKQNGYRVLHDVLKAGMLEKTGIGKTYAEPQRPMQQRLTVPRAAIDTDGMGGNPTVNGMRVIASDPLPEDQQPPLPDPIAVIDGSTGMVVQHQPPRPEPDVMHAVTIEMPRPPVIRDEAVPNEWMRVSPDTVDLDESPYVGQCSPKSISQLVAMGYEYEMLKDLWDNATADTIVESARDGDRAKDRNTINMRRGVQRLLWLYEEYPLYDLDGDGISERLFVHRIGRRVLKVMPVDEQPYSGWSPIPMQHRFTGQSVADKTMDIQRIRSVLGRQALNSLYLSNAPRMLVPYESLTENTMDDLLTVRPGGLVEYKGGVAPSPLQMTDTSSTAFQAMEMMSGERESRTGVTRQSQGLNPDTLNKTASGMAMLQANSDQFELYVARNFVEQYFARASAKRYRLMKAFTSPFRMKIDGAYQEIDPARWPDDMDMQINVGIGTGTKDQRVAALSQLISSQAEAKAGGARWVTDENQYNAAQQWIEDTGLGAPSRFITDPSTLPPEEPQADPNAVKAQVDAQTQQAKDAQAHQQVMAKLQLQQEEQNASAQLRAQANEQDLAAKRESAALDIQLKREKAAEEARLAQEAQQFEQGLAIRRQQFNEQQAQRRGAQAEQDDGLTRFRPGGDLDQ